MECLIGTIGQCLLFFCLPVLLTNEMAVWIAVLFVIVAACLHSTTTIISMSGDDGQEYLINNGRRYEVTIPKYSRQQDYILYEATVLDTAFYLTSSLSFRFKTLKKMHEQMLKQTAADVLP